MFGFVFSNIIHTIMKFLKNTLIFILSLLSGVVVGICGFFIVKAVINVNTHNNDMAPRGKIAYKIDRDYKTNKNFTLIEYEYEGKTFLGPEGLELLNNVINEKLPFGSEVDQLKSISFNDTSVLPKSIDLINGQYNPSTMELNIDLRRFIKNSSYDSSSLMTRVNWVYSVILHEYGHHLANSYITSIRFDDSQNINYQNPKQMLSLYHEEKNKKLFLVKNLSKNFYNEWINALNYNNEQLSKIEKEIPGATLDQKDPNNKRVPNISSKELFDVANYPIYNLPIYNDYINKINSLYKRAEISIMNGNGAVGLSVVDLPISNLVRYTYGIDELLTRHLVSFNYIPHPNNMKNYYDYFTFNLESLQISNYKTSGNIELNSYAPDVILKQPIEIKINDADRSVSYVWNNRIHQADNIFGGELTNTWVTPKFNEILNSYRSAFGYGKLISQIYFDNSNKKTNDKNSMDFGKYKPEDFSKIKIGGYLPKNSKIGGLLLMSNNGTVIQEIKIHKLKSTSLKAKSSPIATEYIPISDDYDQYISDVIDLNYKDLSNISLSYWEDNDINGIFEPNIGDSIKLFTQSDITTSRPITTFRETLESHFVDEKNNKQTIVPPDAKQAKIYYLKYDKKLMFSCETI